MDEVVKGLDFVFGYIVNILVTSKTEEKKTEEKKLHSQILFKRIVKFNVKINALM